MEELNKKLEEESEVIPTNESKEDRVRRVLKKGMEQLKEEKEEERKANYSEETKQILEDRRKAVLEKNIGEYESLTKQFRKKQRERQKRKHTALNKKRTRH